VSSDANYFESVGLASFDPPYNFSLKAVHRTSDSQVAKPDHWTQQLFFQLTRFIYFKARLTSAIEQPQGFLETRRKVGEAIVPFLVLRV
jgi:hypothetical protein